MNPRDRKKQDDAQLRAAAEAQLANGRMAESLAGPADQLLHQLQVHQIELEMQNEALREAQIALTETRDRYVDLYEFAPVGYLTLTFDGTISEVNLTGAALLGRERKRLLNKRFASLVFAKDRDRWISHFSSLKQGDGQGSAELALQRGDGSAFDVSLTCVHRKGGAPDVQVALVDIGARKRAEDALRESEERWKFALEGSGNGVWDWNLKTGAATFSRRWKEMLGYAENDIKDDSAEWVKRVCPEDLPNVMAKIQEHLDGTSATATVEFRMLAKDGSWRWILGSGMLVSRDAGGKPLRFVGTNADITERKQAEMDLSRRQESERRGMQGELRRAADRLGAIASNLPGMMFELTQRGHRRQFSHVSDGLRELFGFAADGLPQAFDSMLLAIVRDEDRELLLQSLERSAQALSPWGWTGQVIGPRDELRWVEFRATPKANDDGSLVWDGIAADVTAAKASELALNDTRQLLHDISVGHEIIREDERIRIARELHDELGQVLTGVKLHLSAMRLRIEPGEAALKTQTAYVMRQVDQAIALTRNAVVHLRPPALDHGLSAAVAWLADQFTQRTGINCRVNLPEAGIELDETRATAVFRILQESLTNIARHAGATEAAVDLSVRGARLHLQVSDDGRGFQEHQAVAGRSFGLLGMRERMAMLGGHFEISSSGDKGTTVAIDIALEGGAT